MYRQGFTISERIPKFCLSFLLNLMGFLHLFRPRSVASGRQRCPLPFLAPLIVTFLSVSRAPLTYIASSASLSSFLSPSLFSCRPSFVHVSLHMLWLSTSSLLPLLPSTSLSPYFYISISLSYYPFVSFFHFPSLIPPPPGCFFTFHVLYFAPHLVRYLVFSSSFYLHSHPSSSVSMFFSSSPFCHLHVCYSLSSSFSSSFFNLPCLSLVLHLVLFLVLSSSSSSASSLSHQLSCPLPCPIFSSSLSLLCPLPRSLFDLFLVLYFSSLSVISSFLLSRSWSVFVLFPLPSSCLHSLYFLSSVVSSSSLCPSPLAGPSLPSSCR